MSRLLRFRIDVPGEYRDLWLYKNHLYIWDRLGAMSFLDLDEAVRHLAANYGSAVAVLAQNLLFRNDWKVSEQLRSMLSVQEIEDAFFLPFDDRDEIVVELSASLFSPSASESYGGTVLDTLFYADRVYFGTSDGLLEGYISPSSPSSPSSPESNHGLQQQTDFRVAKISAGYAAINASAEDKGLHFARMRFTLPNEMPGFTRADWRRIADFSSSTSHAAHNLLNYTDASAPSLLRARVTRAPTHERAQHEEYQVIGYEDPEDLSSITCAAAAANAMAGGRANRVEPAGEVQVLGNSNYHLLAAQNDRFAVVDIQAREGAETKARPSPGYTNTDIGAVSPERILETYPINGGFVVELYDSLHLITKEGGFPLVGGQIARVRTFAKSIRYKEVVATVEENAASLTGFHVVREPGRGRAGGRH